MLLVRRLTDSGHGPPSGTAKPEVRTRTTDGISRLKPTFKAKGANNRTRALLPSAAYAVSCYPDEIRTILMTSSAAVRFSQV